MILLMRNHVDEFVPGCGYTAVRIDRRLVETVARRAAACRAMLDGDPSLADASYWDTGPRCMQPRGADAADGIERTLDHGDGWAVVDDAVVDGLEAVACDCTLMTLCLGSGTTVLWDYRVGSEPVQTVDVPLDELGRRLGSPLGDPLTGTP